MGSNRALPGCVDSVRALRAALSRENEWLKQKTFVLSRTVPSPPPHIQGTVPLEFLQGNLNPKESTCLVPGRGRQPVRELPRLGAGVFLGSGSEGWALGAPWGSAGPSAPACCDEADCCAVWRGALVRGAGDLQPHRPHFYTAGLAEQGASEPSGDAPPRLCPTGWPRGPIPISALCPGAENIRAEGLSRGTGGA